MLRNPLVKDSITMRSRKEGALWCSGAVHGLPHAVSSRVPHMQSNHAECTSAKMGCFGYQSKHTSEASRKG